jgi:hypothetical protein
MFSITELTSKLSETNGVLMSPHFYVEITPGKTGGQVAASLGNKNQNIRFFCISAALPGLTLGTRDIKQSGYGISEKRPVGASYQDFQLTFLCDGKAQMLQFFHQRLQNIHNTDGNMSSDQAYNGLRLYDFQYPEEYEATMKIYHYDRAGTKIIEYTMVGVYPLSVSDVPISWENREDILKIQVNFSYNYWTSNLLDRATQSAPQTALTSVIKSGDPNNPFINIGFSQSENESADTPTAE